MKFDSNRKRRRPKSSRWWCEHFRRNAENPLCIRSTGSSELTAAERDRISASVRAFQLGESGQGRHILRVAGDYAVRSGDADYLDAMRLFIREEQRHGEYLGQFLDLERIPRIDRQWTNGVFYWLRHIAGLELTIAILLTAELIAMVYYATLREATGSATLKRICEHIVKDEAAHLRFQTDRLAMIRRGRPRWIVWITQFLATCLYCGTCVTVWSTHRKVFQAGNMGWREFARCASRELRMALRQMDPRSVADSVRIQAPRLSRAARGQTIS